jgi:hypothetical protein
MRWLNVACCLTFALTVPALAQNNPAPADNTELVRQKLKADKKLLVAENMKMTDTEANAFWPVYDAFQADLAKLSDRAIKLVQYYAANSSTMTDTAATRMTDEYLALERDRAALLQTYRPKFSAALPPLKVARYYQIENKIRAIVNYELAKGIPLL